MSERDQLQSERDAEQDDNYSRRWFLGISALAGATLGIPRLVSIASADGEDHDSEDDDTCDDDRDDNSDEKASHQSSNSGQGGITKREAKQIATNKVGGTVRDIELEREDGIDVYEVEVRKQNGPDKEVEITRQSGTIIEIENESDRDDNSDEKAPHQSSNSGQGGITKREAKQIATNKVGGTVRDIELEREDGIDVYEVEVRKQNGPDKEVEITRQSGTIVEIENESHQFGD